MNAPILLRVTSPPLRVTSLPPRVTSPRLSGISHAEKVGTADVRVPCKRQIRAIENSARSLVLGKENE